MKFIKFLALFCFLFITLNSCSTFSEAAKALRNEKTSSSDEFLIQKKDPLSQPPDYETIPEPGAVENLKKNEEFWLPLAAPRPLPEFFYLKKFQLCIERFFVHSIAGKRQPIFITHPVSHCLQGGQSKLAAYGRV